MDIKRIVLLIICVTAVAVSGEKKLTGNFGWDIVNNHRDTIMAETSLLIQPGEKQNPFMNGLYSLVLPGAGQYHSERYTKAAVFISVEIALAAYAIINNRNGNKKTSEFQAYADAHWDAVRYAKWIGTYGVSDYGPIVAFTQADYDAVRNRDFSKVNAWESGQLGNHKLGFSHQLPKYGEQQYFELIGKYNQFKFGWDTYPQDANGVPISDGGRYDELIPQQLKDYAVERGKANDYYYAASFAMSALVINHVISAVDAIFSTKSFNNEVTASLNLKPVDGLEGKRLLSELTLKVQF